MTGIIRDSPFLSRFFGTKRDCPFLTRVKLFVDDVRIKSTVLFHLDGKSSTIWEGSYFLKGIVRSLTMVETCIIREVEPSEQVYFLL